jgi:hypothetical protein
VPQHDDRLLRLRSGGGEPDLDDRQQEASFHRCVLFI